MILQLAALMIGLVGITAFSLPLRAPGATPSQLGQKDLAQQPVTG